MNLNDKNNLYLTLAFLILIALDLLIVAGILLKGHANFSAVYHNIIS